MNERSGTSSDESTSSMASQQSEAIVVADTRNSSPPTEPSEANEPLNTTSGKPRRQRAMIRQNTKSAAPSAEPVSGAKRSSTKTIAVEPRRRQARHDPLPHSEPPAADLSDAKHYAMTNFAPRRRQRASAVSNTTLAPPSADNSGASPDTTATADTPRRRRARRIANTGSSMPSADTSGARSPVATNALAPRRREANVYADTTLCQPPDDLEQTCLRLAELQKVRRFCIISQSRSDRSMQAAIARSLGYDPEADETDRKAVFRRAGAIIKAVEAGESYDRLPLGDPRSETLWSFLPLIPISAQSRAVWDEQREAAEREMRRLAATLPVMAWVKEHAKGVGELGLARLVGEAPLIDAYQTHEKLWKRLGLAVIAGERQQRKTDKGEALIHGYSPRRRAESWSVCSDSMFRQQWRSGSDDDSIGTPNGPYGAVYAARKAYTLARIAETEALPFTDSSKWTRKRCDVDARRVMTKEFLRDLWRVWHGQEARHPARFEQPKAA